MLKCNFEIYQEKGSKSIAELSPPNQMETSKIVDILKATRGPYDCFNRKYKLEDVVDILVEIWDEDDVGFK